MSTVIYCFKCSNQDDLHSKVELMKSLAKENKLNVFCSEGIEIQVFNTLSTGIIFRVLEVGYGLKNILWKLPELFPTCNYDDRSDLSEEDQKNEIIINEIDQLIFSKQYQIISIVV